jgi:N-acetylmuramoyl-L-alanine amidase
VKKLKLLSGFLATFFWLIFAHAQTLTVTAIEQDPTKQFWNVIFSAADPIQEQHFLLTDPNRWVVDVSDVDSLKTIASLQNTPIQKIRSAMRQPQTLRIVLDLKTAASPNAVHLVFKTQAAGRRIMKEDSKIKQNDYIVIVIDPGHGGKDPGAIGIKNVHEKAVVLSIAQKLEQLINQQPGFKAVLTRNGDYYLTLRQRLAIARQYHADMFIAIHADAYRDPLAHGFSVFALSLRGATSEAARWLAARENQSELMGGVDLADKEDILRSVLINLSQTATIEASLSIGWNLLNDVQTFAHLHHQKVEQAAFVVLKSPDIPSLLIETGFLSNAQEEKKLSSDSYQYSLTKAMMQGIQQYFIRHSESAHETH